VFEAKYQLKRVTAAIHARHSHAALWTEKANL